MMTPLGRCASRHEDTLTLVDAETAAAFRCGLEVVASPYADGSGLRRGSARVRMAYGDVGTVTLDRADDIVALCGTDFLFAAPPLFDRPPLEEYVRVTFEAHGFTWEPAIEWREGDDFDALAAKLEDVATDPVAWEMPRNAMDAALRIKRHLLKTWPDRAFFVEVWQDGKRGFAQVFQPFGLPRNR